jgi:hypothetical protein
LRLKDGGHFEARQPNKSLLTVAPISVEGHAEIAQTDWDGNLTGLRVPDGKTLSLIGGHIDIGPGSYYETDEFDFEYGGYSKRLGNLTSRSGQINLVSVASAGEVIPKMSDLDVSSFNKLGDITVSNNSLITANGNEAGSIFIRSGQLFVTKGSRIQANRFNNKTNESSTTLRENPENKIGINVKVQNLSLTDSSFLTSDSFTKLDSGNIFSFPNSVWECRPQCSALYNPNLSLQRRNNWVRVKLIENSENRGQTTFKIWPKRA